ncbi:unnamed protein product [Jaminaea pallidilutea]
MKSFASIAIVAAAIVGAASAAAVEPRATAAPVVERQIDASNPAVQSIIQQYSPLLTIPAFQSVVASVQADPGFQSALSAAGMSNLAPIESYASSLEGNPQLSSLLVSAVGSSSAAAFYSTAEAVASSATASAGAASSTASSTATGDDSDSDNDSSTSMEAASSSSMADASSSMTASSPGTTTAAGASSSSGNAAGVMKAPVTAGLGLVAAAAIFVAAI